MRDLFKGFFPALIVVLLIGLFLWGSLSRSGDKNAVPGGDIAIERMDEVLSYVEYTGDTDIYLWFLERIDPEYLSEYVHNEFGEDFSDSFTDGYREGYNDGFDDVLNGTAEKDPRY